MHGLLQLVRRRRLLSGSLKVEALASVLVIAISLLFILPVSVWLWEHLPLINLAQFPWRFLAFIALPSSLLAGIFVNWVPSSKRSLVAVALVVLTVFSNTASLSPIISNIGESDVSRIGSLEFELDYNLMGTTADNEYVPKTVKDVPTISPMAVATILGEEPPAVWPPLPPGVDVTQKEVSVNQSIYEVKAQQPAVLVLSKVFFPGWEAFVDGRSAEISVTEPYGLIKLTVPAGEHTVTLRFVETPLRKATDVISAATLVVILGMFLLGARNRSFPIMRLPSLSLDRMVGIRIAAIVTLLALWPAAKFAYDSTQNSVSLHRYPLQIDLEQGISIEGYDLTGVDGTFTSAVRVTPGSPFALDIFWRDLNPEPSPRVRPFALMTNNSGQTIAFGEAPVALPPPGWKAGNLVTTSLAMNIPSKTAPGLYHIRFGFTNSSGEVLKPQSVHRVPLYPWAWIARTAPIVVRRDASPTATSLVPPVNFGDALRLVDLSISEGRTFSTGKPGGPLPNDSTGNGWAIRAGQALHLDMLWQAAKALPEDYWITARLADADGFLWTIHDSPLATGSYPTTFWSKDEIVRDKIDLAIPPETPPGRYELKLEVISKAGPLSILDNDVPVGPAMNVGLVTLLPADVPPDPKDVKVGKLLNQPVGGGIMILGLDLDRSELSAGELLETQLVWRATKSVGRDLAMRLQLVDKQGKMLVGVAGSPIGDGYPTSIWREGEILRGHYRLQLPATASAGEADLVLITLDAGTEERLGSLDLGRVKVLPRDRMFSAAPANSLRKEFAQEIRLLGYDVAGGERKQTVPFLTATPGDALTVALYWQAIREMHASYTVFVQLLNAEGRLLAQSDSIPMGGKEPTTSWLPGQVVKDNHVVLLPPTLPEGNYRIITGLYEASSGKRLALEDGADLVSLFSVKIAASRQ